MRSFFALLPTLTTFDFFVSGTAPISTCGCCEPAKSVQYTFCFVAAGRAHAAGAATPPGTAGARLLPEQPASNASAKRRATYVRIIGTSSRHIIAQTRSLIKERAAPIISVGAPLRSAAGEVDRAATRGRFPEDGLAFAETSLDDAAFPTRTEESRACRAVELPSIAQRSHRPFVDVPISGVTGFERASLRSRTPDEIRGLAGGGKYDEGTVFQHDLYVRLYHARCHLIDI